MKILTYSQKENIRIFFRKLFKKKKSFYLEPFYYIDSKGNEIGSTCKWLEKKSVEAFSENEAIKIHTDYLKSKYPELKSKTIYFF